MSMGTFHGYMLCEEVPETEPKSGILLPPTDMTKVFKVVVGNSNVQAGQYIVVHKSTTKFYLASRVTSYGGNARFFVSGEDVIATLAEKDVR